MHQVGDLFEYMMMHGLTTPKFKSNIIVQIAKQQYAPTLKKQKL